MARFRIRNKKVQAIGVLEGVLTTICQLWSTNASLTEGQIKAAFRGWVIVAREHLADNITANIFNAVLGDFLNDIEFSAPELYQQIQQIMAECW